MKIDAVQIQRAWDIFHCLDDVVHLRLRTKAGDIHWGNFKRADFIKEFTEACYLTEIETAWWSIQPAKLEPVALRQGRGSFSTTDVASRSWIFLDFDTPNKPASDAERVEALTRAKEVISWMKERGVASPCVVMSGNGLQAFLRVDFPNDEEHNNLVKSFTTMLAEKFPVANIDVNCAQVARVPKLPGSVARKGDESEGREHRTAVILSKSNEFAVTAKSVFAKILFDEGFPKEQARSPRSVHPEFDPHAFLSHYELAYKEFTRGPKTLFSLAECPYAERKHRGGDDVTCFVLGDTFGFSCLECKVSLATVLEKLNKEHEPYPHAIFEDRWWEKVGDMIDFGDEANTSAGTDNAAADAKQVTSDSVQAVKEQIDEMMRLPAEELPAREKSRTVCNLILKHLLASGKLYNCGNVATYVSNDTRELIEVMKGGQKFERLLIQYGVYPGEKLSEDIGKFLGAYAVNAPKNTVYTMAFYERDEHVLYVNEYAGSFLRIEGSGRVTRLRNGDDDMLFADGEEAQCDPLCANVESVNKQVLPTDPSEIVSADTLEAFLNAQQLDPRNNSLITKHILDTILYPEEGVGRKNAHAILMTVLLALFFHERIPSMPYVYLYGPGASMKSSLAVKVGKLIQGRRFRPRPATSDEKALKDMAISLPFLVLDEANSVKKLMDLLKTLATGGMDTRRELYTTARVRHTPYQARIWMTANTASLTNETISSRMMIIDAGARTEEEPYRSEHYLEWTADLRNQIWTELIESLSNAMRELAAADAKGEGDLSISHRMSSFFVFGRALARREGWEDRYMEAVQAMEARQEMSSVEGNDIVDLVSALPASYANTPRLAKEWAAILSQLVPVANVELKRAAARTNWVAWQFSSNAHTLTLQCGMQVRVDKHTKSTRYAFTKLSGKLEPKDLTPEEVI